MDDFNSETDSDYTSYWRDWVGLAFCSRCAWSALQCICDVFRGISMGTTLLIHCVISTALPSTTTGSLSPDLESSAPDRKSPYAQLSVAHVFSQIDYPFLSVTTMPVREVLSDESSDSASGHGVFPVPLDERPREIVYMRPPMHGLPTPDFYESSSEESLDQTYLMTVFGLIS